MTRRTRTGRARGGRVGLAPWITSGLLVLGCEAPGDWTPTGPYVGGGAVYGFQDFDLDEAEDDAGVDLDADGNVGADLRVGYRFNPIVAVELQGQWFDSFDIHATGLPDSEVDVWTVTLNGKFYADLFRRVKPYGLLGLGYMNGDLHGQSFLEDFDDGDVVGRAGLGLDTYLSEKTIWYVEGVYVYPFDDLEGLNIFAVATGFQWSF